MLNEAGLKLADLKEAILIIVYVFDGAPHFGHLVWVFGHDRPNVGFINLLKALKL